MTKNNVFLKVLDKVDARIHSMRLRSSEVRMLCDAGNIEDAYERALKLEAVTEQAVLITRILPVYTGSPKADTDVENLLRQNIPVNIGFSKEGWFCLSIPALLPKKAEGSADYVRSFLYPAMRDFFINRPPVRFCDCVLVYRHVYDRTRPERRMRDHDNIEINMVSDIVAMYVMPDDGPEICSHYYCSAKGSADRTEVYVVPRRDFSVWLAAEAFMPDEGITLVENKE